MYRKMVVARKSYSCSGCGREIVRGETYCRWGKRSNLGSGSSWANGSACAPCATAEQAAAAARLRRAA